MTYVARSLASGGVNAQDIVRDDRSVNGSAFSGGNTRDGHLAKFSRGATGSCYKHINIVTYGSDG